MPVRVSAAKPCATASTEYVPGGGPAASNRPSAPVTFLRAMAEAEFLIVTVAPASAPSVPT
ncbi:MAG TPA: hypothetical protein VKV17_09155 [Bryobacteraceae bacterium]|nr:hypothetical protein [Bryobacteraceae bacterium]